MPLGVLLEAVAGAAKEGIQGAVKESVKIMQTLDKPLNLAEVKETVCKETDFDSRLKELDKPLNAGEGLQQPDGPLSAGEGLRQPDRLLGSADGFWPPDDSKKAELRGRTPWPDKVIEACRINEDGVIRYPCRNEHLAGKTNELTGVKYERRIVEAYGYKVEVVVPKFETVFDLKLPDGLIRATDRDQFKECNRQLYNAVKEDSELAKCFNAEQLEQIEEGMAKGGAPDGFTWHHDAETGRMQLVDSDLHGDSRHTGGKAIWGGGSDFR